MGERDISSLEGVPPQEAPAATPAKAAARPPRAEPSVPPPAVELNYPDPTLLSIVVRDVARWSRLAFVMEPTVNTKIQIFAPRKMQPAEAYDLFLASLGVVGLRAVQSGSVVKIVPVSLSVSA